MNQPESTRWADARLSLLVAPALIVGVVFELFLGHRHDYAGHYAAGYGGTLGAIMVVLRLIGTSRYERMSTLALLATCIACILLGTVTEATIFRLAKFDEIDWCSQSLGAVLAACAALSYAGRVKTSEIAYDVGLIIGIAFLGIGGVLAVA